MPKTKTAAQTLVELGVTLARAEASATAPASCKRCSAAHDASLSNSRYPSIFCSKSCERDFIRTELASLTVEDCMRLQTKLDDLLRGRQKPSPFEKKQL